MIHSNFPLVCDAIKAPDSDQLLRLLVSVYEGAHDEDGLQYEFGQDALSNGIALGVLEFHKKGRVTLTALGYLLANVAKEYLVQWVDNNRQVRPPFPPDDLIRGKDVLDLGCSFGRWLWRFQRTARSVVGLEMQKEYIEFGRALAEREQIPVPEIRQGSVEELSSCVPGDSVDFVFVRLVLAKVHIMKTLLQIADVLRNGGIVWVQVEPWHYTFRQLLRRDEGRELRNKGFALFSIVNSIVFMTVHQQMSMQVHGRMHSVHKPVYPTLRAWKAALFRAGLHDFHEVATTEYAGYVFWARKI